MIYVKRLIPIVLITIFLTNCTLFLNKNEKILGVISIILPDAIDNKKSISPAIDFRMTSFDISGTGPNGATFEILDYASGSLEKTGLAVGSWTIQVFGSNSAGELIGTGTGSVEVKPSSTSKLTIELSPIEGVGSLIIRMDLQDPGILNAVFETSLLSLDGTISHPAVTNLDNQRSISLDLASGFYSITIKALIDSVPVWGIEESVVILKGQNTEASYLLDSGTINKRPATPSNLTSVWTTESSIELRWKDNTAIETAYFVQRKEEGSDLPFQTIAELRENTTLYRDSGPFTRGKKYNYQILAVHPLQNSEPSAGISFLVPMAIEVSGKLTKNQVWTKGNEYFIAANVLIPVGITLSIEPGASILVGSQEFYIKVDGTILCDGTESLPVKFSGKNGITWQGLKITNLSTGSRINFSEFNNGNLSIESSVTIKNCTFTSNPITLGGNSSSISIENSRIHSGISTGNTNLTIKNSEIRNQGGTAISFGGGTVRLEGNLVNSSNTGFMSNWQGGSITLISNTFKDIYSRAIDMGGFSGTFIMDSNEIASCSVALFVYYYFSNYTITNNYFYDCGISFHIYEMYNPWGGTVQGNVVNRCYGEAAILLEGNIGTGLNNVVFKDNNFYNPEAEYEVKLRSNVRGSGPIINLMGNYWGTVDIDSIQKRIYDSNIDFELYTVEFDPPAGTIELLATAISPENGIEVNNSAQYLKWKVNGWSPAYKIQVSETLDFNGLLFELLDIAERGYLLSNPSIYSLFTEENTYYWRVAPKLETGTYGIFSQPSAFTIRLPVPDLVSPVHESRLYQGWNPLLEWLGSDVFNLYRLELDDTMDFSSPILTTETPNTSYQTPFVLPEGTTYYWRVKGRDVNGTWGKFSNPYSFRIPLPGIGLEIETDLPGQISLTLVGAEQVSAAGGAIFTIQTNIVPSEVEWTINGSVAGNGNTFIFPAMARGVYTLGARIVFKDRSYSASKICRVVASQEVAL